MKKCYKCFAEKSLSSFSKDKKTRDGLNTVCKECWSLENLQPLWAKDNIVKSNKWEENC